MTRNSIIRLRSGREIGQGCPCFLVAEIGNNHQGSAEMARQLVQSAADAGADAVKFQKRDVSALLTQEGLGAPYTGPNSFGPTYGEHRERLELDIHELEDIKAYAESLGLVFFASVWDEPSLTAMHALQAWPIKIPSADLTNLPLLRKAAALGGPIILSTGMSEIREIDIAVRELTTHHRNLVLLHCNSSYPCPDSETGVKVMFKLKERYDLPVGYSGHERGLGPSLAAAAMGACIVERHFTLDNALPGTDHKASLMPEKFSELARTIRSMEAAMSADEKCISPAERSTAIKLRKSVVFSRPLPSGHIISEEDITTKCPGTGISPLYWDDIIGSQLVKSVSRDQLFNWDLVDGSNQVLNKVMS